MPGNPRQIIADAELKFPVRVAVKTPPEGLGERYMRITDWLDENCGIGGWSITPAGTRGVANDAIAVYFREPTCALGFGARWCVAGEPPGFYQVREDEPVRRTPTQWAQFAAARRVTISLYCVCW